MKEQQLFTWLAEQSKKIRYGEITIKLVLHDGQVRCIEKSVTERERPESGGGHG